VRQAIGAERRRRTQARAAASWGESSLQSRLLYCVVSCSLYCAWELSENGRDCVSPAVTPEVRTHMMPRRGLPHCCRLAATLTTAQSFASISSHRSVPARRTPCPAPSRGLGPFDGKQSSVSPIQLGGPLTASRTPRAHVQLVPRPLISRPNSRCRRLPLSQHRHRCCP
jgi:hypothetical protein